MAFDQEPIIERTSPTGKQFPPGLGRIMMVLHDELSKRTSGELPADFHQTVKPQWAAPQKFDRDARVTIRRGYATMNSTFMANRGRSFG